MKICVISLEGSFDRRASIQAQLNPLGVDYEIFRAIEGPRGYTFFDSYDERAFLINTGRHATAGEAGCYASHLCLWQQCVHENSPILIMEDDAQLRPNFLASLYEAESLIDECGFIRLQPDRPLSDRRPRARRRVVLSSGDFTLYLFSHYPYGALCYAIAPRVAKAFIDCSRALKEPVDCFIKKPWVHGAPLFGLQPYSVFSKQFASTIGRREKDSPTLNLRTSRWLSKISNRANKTKFNFTVDSQLAGRLRAHIEHASKRV